MLVRFTTDQHKTLCQDVSLLTTIDLLEAELSNHKKEEEGENKPLLPLLALPRLLPNLFVMTSRWTIAATKEANAPSCIPVLLDAVFDAAAAL